MKYLLPQHSGHNSQHYSFRLKVINYEPISLTTDLWSVGVIAYVLLSGLSPFVGADHSETFDNITGLKYGFDDPEFQDVTELAKDFISSLLVLDCKRRPSATMALGHGWLADDHDVAAGLERKGANHRSRLGNFLAKQRWQNCVNVTIACSALREGLESASTSHVEVGR